MNGRFTLDCVVIFASLCFIVLAKGSEQNPENLVKKPFRNTKYNSSNMDWKTLPSIVERYMSTFRNMEGYTYKLWGNVDLTRENFPRTWKYIQELLNKPKIIYAMIADLMRLEILFRHGGIYVDASMEALKNLDVIFEKTDASFIMSNERLPWSSS